MMQATADRIIYTPAKVARFIGDPAAVARRIDRDYRLQLNQDQVLWEVAKERVGGADIRRLCVDTVNLFDSEIVHRVHVYGYGEGKYAGAIFVAASRCGNRWKLTDPQFARSIGMDLLFEVCRDEVSSAWPDLDIGHDTIRLFDELAEEARQTVLDMHWKPEQAAEHVVDYYLRDRGWWM